VPIADECLRRARARGFEPAYSALADQRLDYFRKTGDAAGCRAPAERWEKVRGKGAGSLYHAARYWSGTAAVPRAAGGQEAKAASDRAVDRLRQALAAGYKDAAGLQQDKDLEALRDRAEFARSCRV
jgi:hypothetical protein